MQEKEERRNEPAEPSLRACVLFLKDHCEKLPTTACAVCMFALFGDGKIEGMSPLHWHWRKLSGFLIFLACVGRHEAGQALGKQGKGLERLVCGCMYHNSCLRNYISVRDSVTLLFPPSTCFGLALTNSSAILLLLMSHNRKLAEAIIFSTRKCIN